MKENIGTQNIKNLALYKNSEISIDERVNALLEVMTLDEKIAQMLCIWEDKKTVLLDESGNLSFNKFVENFEHGIGQIGRISDTGGGLSDSDTGKDSVEMAQLTNQIQKFVIENTRLGIPVIFHEETLHGLAAREATSYPQPIGMASTFNPDLIEEIFTSIAKNVRQRGAHQALAPVVDVGRDPRWGRIEETFGEDPYLVTQCGIAAVKGLQGDGNNKERVIATLKHFVGHGQPESGTNIGPANYSERVLREVFIAPFQHIIKKVNVKSIMPSYNEVDGIPSHANKWLLKKVLREEFGFKGVLVSDYFAITELFMKEGTTGHFLAANLKEAAKLALEAGVNIELPDPSCYPYLKELVEEKAISISQIDELVVPLLKQKFELGLFDNPYVDSDKLDINTTLLKERDAALQAAEETITLLKNENDLLPLNRSEYSKIAVIGPNADRELLGGYSGVPKYFTSVLEGIREKVDDQVEVLYSEGCKITVSSGWTEDEVIFPDPEEDLNLIEKAVEVADQSDIVILALGGNEQTSREAWGVEHLGDRANLDLIGMQNDLVEAILKTGKPIVVLLFNGRPNSINFISQNVPSILECWYLGQETGNSVANVLFGDVNPSGKLPISIPRSAGHIPCFYNHKPSARRGYLQDETSALYPFGFGLSYTKFQINNLKLEKETIRTSDSVSVFVEVKNIGSRKGKEVVQLYIRDKVSSVTRPVKELKGFSKVSLLPGETKRVTFTISPEELAFYNVDMEYLVEPGEFEIMVGSSSKDEDMLRTILSVR